MKSLLLDTHAWAWSLNDDPRLSDKARVLIEQAESVFVSPISIFEIGQKVRHGKWPEMEPFIDRLPRLLEEQGGKVAALTPEICLTAAMMSWAHRDPFDRMLAATAMHGNQPLVSTDTVFDQLGDCEEWIARLW